MMSSAELDDAIDALAEPAFQLLERLVSEPSTIGQENGSQNVLAAELEALAFTVTRLEIPEDIADHPAAGVPRMSYEGRFDLIAQRGTGSGGRTLIINGHMDVVPANEPDRWSRSPFAPYREDGWLVGRGAGDMKGGFAAGMLALRALDASEPGWQHGELTVVAAIEEEATGNGTLAAGRAGYLAEAAVLLEPTDLEILLGGIALVWVSIQLEGRAGHAEAALASVNPIDVIPAVMSALRSLEREFNDAHESGVGADAAFENIPHPYNLNIGTVNAGDWASSVPAVARLEVRIGHPRSLSAGTVLERVSKLLAEATAENEWFAEHPPTVSLSGYRAERYLQDASAEIVTALSAAHREVHAVNPALVTIGSTTDARFYLNQFDVPAVAYGPVTRNMHGTDEAVELASIVATAKTLARFLRAWFAQGVEAQ